MNTDSYLTHHHKVSNLGCQRWVGTARHGHRTLELSSNNCTACNFILKINSNKSSPTRSYEYRGHCRWIDKLKMAYYDHRSGRYYSPSPPPRRRASRTESFLDNMGRGRVKDALGALVPGSDDKRHRSQHGSHRRRSYDDGYYSPSDDDYYYEEKRPSHRHRRHRGDSNDYYYYDDERPSHRGRSAHGHSQRSYASSSRHGHRARSESGPDWGQATKAAVGAAMIEGWRSRNNPDRLGRIATAAAGAAGTAMAVGGEGDRKSKRHIIEATIGGLAIDRVVNGSRKQ